MIDAAPLGKMAGEDKMQRLLNYARKEAGRWTRTFGKDTPNARAAEAMGTVSSILASIHKELPPRFRPRVERHMRYVEVYARLLESGKVRAYGKLKKEERAAVEDELLDALREAKAKAEEEYELAKKEAKITPQFKKMGCCKYNTTAKFTADAPQGRAYELLRAAISGDHTANVADLDDIVNKNNTWLKPCLCLPGSCGSRWGGVRVG